MTAPDIPALLEEAADELQPIAIGACIGLCLHTACRRKRDFYDRLITAAAWLREEKAKNAEKKSVPVDDPTPTERATYNCWLLARRKVRNDPDGGWAHVIRMCEAAAPEICKASVLREDLRMDPPPPVEAKPGACGHPQSWHSPDGQVRWCETCGSAKYGGIWHPPSATPPPPVDERRMRCCECGERFTLVNCGTCLICRGAKMDATEKMQAIEQKVSCADRTQGPKLPHEPC